MKYAIREVNTASRSVKSERYTLTQRGGLKLFQLAVWNENDTPFETDSPESEELNWLFESRMVEFWATCEETAYGELCDYLKAFNSAGLTQYDDKENPFECENCVAWFENYNAFDLLVIPEGYSKLEIIKTVVEFEGHCVYVLRKMVELVAKIIDECGLDYYLSVVEGD